jgi:mono/diheme cytochrome c family protein
MRLGSGLKISAVIAVAIPAMLFLTATSTLADATPTPSGSALPGDASKGATLFGPNCASCHGATGEGGVGAKLNPIEVLHGVKDKAAALDPLYLIDTITNGRKHQSGDPYAVDMPAKGGNDKLSDQDVKDLASYIIQINASGKPTMTANELARSTMTWVAIGILAMLFVTYLLAQYNMRWIARRAAARRK